MKLSDENPADELSFEAYRRMGRTDWLRSLKRLARAQALLWSNTPVPERQRFLAQVDQEQQS